MSGDLEAALKNLRMCIWHLMEREECRLRRTVILPEVFVQGGEMSHFVEIQPPVIDQWSYRISNLGLNPAEWDAAVTAHRNYEMLVAREKKQHGSTRTNTRREIKQINPELLACYHDTKAKVLAHFYEFIARYTP